MRSNKIKPNSHRWYVRHVERLISLRPNMRLSEHASESIEEYLHELGRNDNVADWQFKQNIVSLRILFCDLLNLDWAPSFSWQDWIDSAKELDSDHATTYRDCNPINIRPSGDLNTKSEVINHLLRV